MPSFKLYVAATLHTDSELSSPTLPVSNDAMQWSLGTRQCKKTSPFEIVVILVVKMSKNDVTYHVTPIISTCHDLR